MAAIVFRLHSAFAVGLVLSVTSALQSTPQKGDPFKITVVDEQTGRGVPLVELRTTNESRYYTDSGGIVAFYEPGLMGQEVFFHVKSHGYEFPKDGFGYRGKKLVVTRGGSAELRIKRINVAERLYRVTGEGIYRDSMLVGHPVPIEQPLFNGQVMGQDSVHARPYRGKLFWIWGDTNRPSYPLGNFGVSGATSDLPEPRGRGLDPRVGVNLKYFVGESGFSRPMIPSEAIPGPGPKWLSGLMAIRDEDSNERLIAKYVRMKSLGETLERGLVLFNDKTESFERLVQFDLDAPLYLDGHPFRANVDGAEYLYFGYSPPYGVRVRANLTHLTNPAAYEGFTCLAAGARFDKAATRLDRGPDGRLAYAWKPDTLPLSYDQQEELIKAGRMKREEAWLKMEDVETGKPIKPHAGSVRWNNYRKRWVMIVEESFGSSNLGEVWYAEADTPLGPWVYARKIVTHDKYSFYNPVHHAFFDQDDGRFIYFEGTYSDLFSGSPEKTPRYDYNQIMYRLDLGDPRLALPAPVYEVRTPDPGGATRLLSREQLDSQAAWETVTRVESTASVVSLYEYRDRRDRNSGRRLYSTDANISDQTLIRTADPLCRVWRNPMTYRLLDTKARPVPVLPNETAR
ncbi:MAG: hypothetical protein HY000_14565 [Planctomycetes bacterium]|nr:hypothetical protein [Planctomycetota bacterium]